MSNESAPNRVSQIIEAKALIAENDLLSRDELTQEKVENGFIVNGEEVDPKEWVAGRLEELEHPVSAAELSRKVSIDFKEREGN
jgi:hypothetical protein